MKNVEFNPVCIQLSRLLMIPIVLFTFYSCDSESSDVPNEVVSAPYKCLTCKTTPEAKAENDNRFEGIYIAVNSNSSVVVDAMNATDDLSAKMAIGAETVNFSAKDIVLDGDVYMARFDGIYQNQPVTFNFSVGQDGENPKIASDSFPGVFAIAKETSTSMLEVFDGVWTAKQNSLGMVLADNIETDTISIDPNTYVTGRFNMLVARSNANENPWWSGVNTLQDQVTYPNGLINSNEMVDVDGHLIGKVNGDELKGVYLNQANQRNYLVARRRI